jgi:glutamate formiminotransferase
MIQQKPERGCYDIAKSLAKLYKSVSVFLHEPATQRFNPQAVQDARNGKTEKISNIKSFIGRFDVCIRIYWSIQKRPKTD